MWLNFIFYGKSVFMLVTKDPLKLRLSLHKGLSILAFVLTGFYIPINFIYLNNPIIGSIEIVICAFSLFSFYQAWQSRNVRWTQYVLVFMVSVLVYTSSYTADLFPNHCLSRALYSLCENRSRYGPALSRHGELHARTLLYLAAVSFV